MCFKDQGQANRVGLYAEGANALFSAFSSYAGAKSERAAYDYQAAIADNNASLAERAAADAVDRGATESAAVRKQGRAVKGAQRAALATGNVDQGFGSALDILTETDIATDVDANTAEANASKEAYALRVRGANYRGDAQMLRMRARATSPLLAGASALLDGVSTVADRWYTMSEKGMLDSPTKKKPVRRQIGPHY